MQSKGTESFLAKTKGEIKMKFKMESLAAHSREMGDRGITEKKKQILRQSKHRAERQKRTIYGKCISWHREIMRNKGDTCHEWRRCQEKVLQKRKPLPREINNHKKQLTSIAQI